jgi:hypothetical protein
MTSGLWLQFRCTGASIRPVSNTAGEVNAVGLNASMPEKHMPVASVYDAGILIPFVTATTYPGSPV